MYCDFSMYTHLNCSKSSKSVKNSHLCPNSPPFTPHGAPLGRGRNMKSGHNYQGRMPHCLNFCVFAFLVRLNGPFQSKTAKIDYFPIFPIVFYCLIAENKEVVLYTPCAWSWALKFVTMHFHIEYFHPSISHQKRIW